MKIFISHRKSSAINTILEHWRRVETVDSFGVVSVSIFMSLSSECKDGTAIIISMGCEYHPRPSGEKIEQQFNLSELFPKKRKGERQHNVPVKWSLSCVFTYYWSKLPLFKNKQKARWKRINCVWHTHSKHAARIVPRIMFLDRSRFIFVSTNFVFPSLTSHKNTSA